MLNALLPFESVVICLLFLYRQKIIAKNEEIYEERCGRSTSIYENDSDILEDDSNEKQELWTQKLLSHTKDDRNTDSLGLENSGEVFWKKCIMSLVAGLPWFYFCLFTICFLLSDWQCLNSHLNYTDFQDSSLRGDVLYIWICSFSGQGTIFSSIFLDFITKTLIWRNSY